MHIGSGYSNVFDGLASYLERGALEGSSSFKCLKALTQTITEENDTSLAFENDMY